MRLPEIRTRRHAGYLLGNRIKSLHISEPITLAISRGAVPIAFEIAQAIGSPLGLEVTRKIVHPKKSELVLGVATEEDFYSIQPSLDCILHLKPTELERILIAEANHLQREAQLYHQYADPLSLVGRNIILVDEIAISGATARAAIETVRQRGARRVGLALPYCLPKTEGVIRRQSSPDVMVILHRVDPRRLQSIHWPPVTDSEVIALLKKARIDSRLACA